jgi:hypothetical protein
MKNYPYTYLKSSSLRNTKTPNYKSQNQNLLNNSLIKINPNTGSNSIADSLKFFVDNSNTVKFIKDPPKKAFTRKFSKDKLYKSIFHQDIFSREKERKKLTKKIGENIDNYKNHNNTYLIEEKNKSSCKKINLI